MVLLGLGEGFGGVVTGLYLFLEFELGLLLLDGESAESVVFVLQYFFIFSY